MITTNKIKCIVAAIASCMLLISCSYEVKSTSPALKPSINLLETIGVIKQGKTKLSEIADLPIHGSAGTLHLQALNKKEGWLYNFNHLWQTKDGGKSWEVLFDESSETAGYSFVQFSNAQVGWRQKINILEKTIDGGHTWEKVALPFKPYEGDIFSINFLPDGKRGWLTGGIYRALDPSKYGELPIRSTNADGTKALEGVIFYTENSGRTWQQQSITAELGEPIGRVRITSSGEAWTFAGYDTFYLEGNKWKKVDYKRCYGNNHMLLQTVAEGDEQGDIYKPQDIYFIDDSHGWLSFADGYMAKTSDGGKTWCDLYKLQRINSGVSRLIYFNN